VAGRVRGARCGRGVPAIVGTFHIAARLDARLGDRKLVDGRG